MPQQVYSPPRRAMANRQAMIIGVFCSVTMKKRFEYLTRFLLRDTGTWIEMDNDTCNPYPPAQLLRGDNGYRVRARRNTRRSGYGRERTTRVDGVL